VVKKKCVQRSVLRASPSGEAVIILLDVPACINLEPRMDLAASNANGQFLGVPLPAVAIGFLTTFWEDSQNGSNKDECTPNR